MPHSRWSSMLICGMRELRTSLRKVPLVPVERRLFVVLRGKPCR
ncbi:hypothetical protein [Streptosporangium sp. NPDC002721]